MISSHALWSPSAARVTKAVTVGSSRTTTPLGSPAQGAWRSVVVLSLTLNPPWADVAHEAADLVFRPLARWILQPGDALRSIHSGGFHEARDRPGDRRRCERGPAPGRIPARLVSAVDVFARGDEADPVSVGAERGGDEVARLIGPTSADRDDVGLGVLKGGRPDLLRHRP